MASDVEVWSLRASGWSPTGIEAVATLADVIALPEKGPSEAALLLSVSAGGIAAVTEAAVMTGATIESAALVGSHANRYTVAADKT